MKLLSLWTEATVKQSFVLFATIAILMIGTSDVFANSDYSSCEGCHGGFLEDDYSPPFGRPSWGAGNSLHSVHQTMVSSDCNVCHTGTSSSRSPVFLDSSNGGNGLEAISCVGCHGRDGDSGNDGGTSPGRGAGLRQHHASAGQTGCQGCHSDANPTNYTPVGEEVDPNYYANPGTGHPAMPTEPCNPTPAFVENFAGTTLGLDNDGDDIYDMADGNCEGVPVELMTFEIE